MLQIFKSGTYEGLFVSTDFPIANDVLGFFELRGRKNHLIPDFNTRENNTLLIRSTGSKKIVMVSLVFYAQDSNFRNGFFSISVCESAENVAKNFSKFLALALANIFKEYRKNDFFDGKKYQILNAPKTKNSSAKPRNINYLPKNFTFQFSQGFGIDYNEKSSLVAITNYFNKLDIFNRLEDGFEIFFNSNHPTLKSDLINLL